MSRSRRELKVLDAAALEAMLVERGWLGFRRFAL